MSVIKFLFSIALLIFVSCRQDDHKILNPNFEKEMVKALNLTFINSDSLYLSPFTTIINDTICGYMWHTEDGGGSDKDFYFIQSLKNLRCKKIFKSSLGYIEPARINALKDGCIYFGGPNLMTSVCQDGTTKQYFEEGHLFYVNQITLYKDRVVVCSMGGISILDINTQKVIWKNRQANLGTSSYTGFIYGNKFIFDGGAFLGCVDLDKLSLIWSNEKSHSGSNVRSQIKNKVSTTVYHYTDNPIASFSKDRELFVYHENKVIDSNTGKVLFYDDKLSYLDVDNDDGYTAMIDSAAVYLGPDFKIRWKLNNIKIRGVHSNSVIGMDRDNTHYIIIDKKTGKVTQKILVERKSDYTVNFLGNYVIFSSINIYK